MAFLSLLLLSAVFALSHGQSNLLTWGNGVSRHLLQQLPMITKSEEFYTKLCVDCYSAGLALMQHPENCGTAVYCVPNLGIFLVKCPERTLFNEMTNTCDNPDTVVCRKDTLRQNLWTPCNDKTPFLNPRKCREYMICIDPDAQAVSSHASIVIRDCPEGQGFDPSIDSCSPSAPCLQFNNTEDSWIRRKVDGPNCGAIFGEDKKYWYNVTARYRRDPNTVVNENFQNDCPAAMHYNQGSTECACARDDIVEECVVSTLANFASSPSGNGDGKDWISWGDAKNKRASISGNATVMNDGRAFFQSTTYTVHTLIYNEMGKYFSMSFNFLSRRRNPSNPASEMLNGATQGVYALVDNSACGISGTYGCSLVVDTQDVGKVMCFMNGTHEEEDVISYNYHSEMSAVKELSQPITVTLTRNNGEVKMEVEQRGEVETLQWVMDKEDRVMGTKCGLTLGAGTAQKYFTGFIDNLKVTKSCP